MQPKNRLGLPVQPGEFIEVRNGIAHVLDYVERWEEAPTLSSGYRQVLVYGMEMPLTDLQAKVLANSGFAPVEARYNQGIGSEPLEQDAFDCMVDFNGNTVVEVITTNRFLALTGDGYYFVQHADPVLTERTRNVILSDWRAGVEGARPGREAAWVPEYVENRPWLNAPWLLTAILGFVTGAGKAVDPEHYNDGLVDVRNVKEFCLFVFTNVDGHTVSVGYDDNGYTPKALLEAYEEISHLGGYDDREKHAAAFRDYLLATGCSEEELE